MRNGYRNARECFNELRLRRFQRELARLVQASKAVPSQPIYLFKEIAMVAKRIQSLGGKK